MEPMGGAASAGSAALSYRQAGKASMGTLMRGTPDGHSTSAPSPEAEPRSQMHVLRRAVWWSHPCTHQPFCLSHPAACPAPVAGKLTGQQTNGKNFSTIPSKFETTLFKERDGFGSRAHRFVDMENDLPGPGTYNDHESKIIDHKVYSKKGLGGGFVSRTKRDSGFKPSSSAPGPGNYEAGGGFYDAVKQANRANRSGSTSTFKPPTQRSVMVAPDPMPGPSDYAIPRAFAGAETLGGPACLFSESSNFRSNTQRSGGGNSGRFTSPAPGSYNPQKPGLLSDATMPMAAFRSTVPIVGRDAPERLTREQQLGVVPHLAKRAPGPGEYELPRSSIEAPAHRRMPQFFDSNHDRFGNVVHGAPSTQYAVPGPGSYIKDGERETAVISGSVFMSGTARTGKASRDVVPGPAYYAPAPQGRKSYHLNARQRWMPAA